MSESLGLKLLPPTGKRGDGRKGGRIPARPHGWAFVALCFGLLRAIDRRRLTVNDRRSTEGRESVDQRQRRGNESVLPDLSD